MLALQGTLAVHGVGMIAIKGNGCLSRSGMIGSDILVISSSQLGKLERGTHLAPF
jgi:hypothetical protein